MLAKKIGLFVELTPGQEVLPGKIIAGIDCTDTANGFVCEIMFADGTKKEVVNPYSIKM